MRGNYQTESFQHIFFNTNAIAQKKIFDQMGIKRFIKEEYFANHPDPQKQNRVLDAAVELTRNRFADFEILNGRLTPELLETYSTDYREAFANQLGVPLKKVFTYIFTHEIDNLISSGITKIPDHVRIYLLDHQWDGTTSVALQITQVVYATAA
jgi:hypothetical protein